MPLPAEQWLGSGPDHFISTVTLDDHGVYIEGVKVATAAEPIRVDKIADDFHVVYLPLFVEYVYHHRGVDRSVQHTYTWAPPEERARRTADHAENSISLKLPDAAQRIDAAIRDSKAEFADAAEAKRIHYETHPPLWERLAATAPPDEPFDTGRVDHLLPALAKTRRP